MNNLFKVTALSFIAFFCMSGQMARKEVQEVPSTQVTINEPELKNEKPKMKDEVKCGASIDEEQNYNGAKKGAKSSMELKLEEEN